jgi:hypothetical protein
VNSLALLYSIFSGMKMEKVKREKKTKHNRVVMHVAITVDIPKKTKLNPYIVGVDGALARLEKLSDIKEIGETYFVFKIAQALGIKTLPTNVSMTIRNLEVL